MPYLRPGVPLLLLFTIACGSQPKQATSTDEPDRPGRSPATRSPGSGPALGDPALDAFVVGLVEALVEADSEAFVDLHVRKGDKTPDGGTIMTNTGHPPDEAWEREVRTAFSECRDRLAFELGNVEELELDRVVEARSREDGLGYYGTKVGVRLDDGGAVLALGMLMYSRRGLVCQDEPTVEISDVVAPTPRQTSTAQPPATAERTPPERPLGPPEWFETVRSGDRDGAAAALNAGQDVNAVNHQGASALHHAIMEENHEMVEFLLERGADVNHADDMGQTALMWAGNKYDWEIANRLLDEGADPSIGVSMMFFVCQSGQTELARRLLDAGLVPDRDDLQVARNFGHADLVTLLESKVP